MSCTFPTHIIEDTIAFHGHSCPGLAIGIRASELAFRELGTPEETNMVAIAETDMCGVDAIQFLTDCTLGKGNFMHRDFGKMAFSFFDRNTGKGFRALLNPENRTDLDVELGVLMGRESEGSATAAELKRIPEVKEILKERLMAMDLDDMFNVTWTQNGPPRPARVLASLTCEKCGEPTMESRTRRFAGKTLCSQCFEAMEQKI